MVYNASSLWGCVECILKEQGPNTPVCQSSAFYPQDLEHQLTSLYINQEDETFLQSFRRKSSFNIFLEINKRFVQIPFFFFLFVKTNTTNINKFLKHCNRYIYDVACKSCPFSSGKLFHLIIRAYIWIY